MPRRKAAQQARGELRFYVSSARLTERSIPDSFSTNLKSTLETVLGTLVTSRPGDRNALYRGVGHEKAWIQAFPLQPDSNNHTHIHTQSDTVFRQTIP